MAKIEIDYTKVCPFLMANPANLKSMSVDLQTGLESNDYCEVGENMLDTHVQTDMMNNPKKVDVNVSCTGCRLLPKGFSKTIEVNVQN